MKTASRSTTWTGKRPLATDKAREVFDAINGHFKFEQPSYIPCPECGGGWCLACNNTGTVLGDPGMRKVVNLVTKKRLSL